MLIASTELVGAPAPAAVTAKRRRVPRPSAAVEPFTDESDRSEGGGGGGAFQGSEEEWEDETDTPADEEYGDEVEDGSEDE